MPMINKVFLGISMHKNQGPVYYGDYLKLNELLGAQTPLSKEHGAESHDETLFIIVHQVYELWFKQILKEFDSCLEIFSQDFVDEKDLSISVARLERVTKIQGLLVTQLEVMETMTPMDFLEFRDLLVPASGFQSAQFREIEIKMGLGTNSRANVDREYFLGRLNEEDKSKLVTLDKAPSLLTQIEGWLERLPFTFQGDFNFWEAYESSVQSMLAEDKKIIEKNFANLDEKQKNMQLSMLDSTVQTFESILDEKIHNKFIESKDRKLSHKATLNALFILLYRDEPILQIPHRLLNTLMDIDENFTTWRYRHALMVHRLLGTKIGTGGSSGHEYLKMAAENNRVYIDLFNLSTYIIPRTLLPELPKNLREEMNFSISNKH